MPMRVFLEDIIIWIGELVMQMRILQSMEGLNRTKRWRGFALCPIAWERCQSSAPGAPGFQDFRLRLESLPLALWPSNYSTAFPGSPGPTSAGLSLVSSHESTPYNKSECVCVCVCLPLIGSISPENPNTAPKVEEHQMACLWSHSKRMAGQEFGPSSLGSKSKVFLWYSRQNESLEATSGLKSCISPLHEHCLLLTYWAGGVWGHRCRGFSNASWFIQHLH